MVSFALCARHIVEFALRIKSLRQEFIWPLVLGGVAIDCEYIELELSTSKQFVLLAKLDLRVGLQDLGHRDGRI